MRAECIDAVTRVIGRKLNTKEVTDIESRLSNGMTSIARTDPQRWRTLTKAQQLDEAAKIAAQELTSEAARNKANIARQALATARNSTQWQSLVSDGRTGASAAIRLFERVDRDIRGTRQQYFTGMLPVIEYMGTAKRWLGWKHDQPMLQDLVKEIFGDNTGNAGAKKAAKAWLDTIEAMRARFNSGGGDVGKLDYAYLPQPHDAIKVMKSGANDWVDFVLPKIDRSRYIKPDGTFFTDAELRQFLTSAHDTISTGGLNKMEPGKAMGTGKLANRHGDARQVHFKDADSYLAYMERFGRGNPASAMQSHISGLARDIALIESMGPNPNQTAQLLIDSAKKMDGSEKLVGVVTARNAWDTLTGVPNHPVNVRLGEIAQGIRNITTAVKLQGAFLSSFTDVGTLALNSHYHKLPVFGVLKDLPKAMGKDYRNYANRVGLMSDSIISDMNRWADGHGGAGWTSKLADTTMKATLLSGWTDSLKRAFSVNMMGGLGKMTRKDWAALDGADRARLERAGIDQATFDVWRAAKPEDWRGSQMLTAEAVANITDPAITNAAKDKAIIKLLGFISDEADTAVTSPDLMARTISQTALGASAQKGTVGGEIWRSLWLFKTFAVSILSRQIGRLKDVNATMGKGAALAYGAGLLSTLTALGGLSLQAKDMVNGKDPRPIDNKKFWGAAFLQGGGMGIFGDILYTALGGNSRGGQPNWTGFAGPVFGTGFDLANLTLGNIGQAAEGKETNMQSELIRFTRQNTPMANLWYVKGAIDHFWVNDWLEQANPGYLRRMRQRAQKDWGQEYYWRPEDSLPSRAPNVESLAED